MRDLNLYYISKQNVKIYPTLENYRAYLPPVIIATLPVRSGISLLGTNFGLRVKGHILTSRREKKRM